MKLDKLDIIQVSMNDFVEVDKWRNANEHLRNQEEINFPLEEVIVLIKDKKVMDEAREYSKRIINEEIPYDEIMVHFKVEGDFDLTFDLYIQESNKRDDNPTLSWKMNQAFFDTGKFEWSSGFKNKRLMTNEIAQRQCLYYTANIFSLFLYMLHAKGNVKEEKERKVISKKAKSNSKSKKNRTVRITTTRYTIDYNNGEKRDYGRHTDAWTVRGHWRYYKKSGKRVWIDSYKKGEGETEGKVYKI